MPTINGILRELQDIAQCSGRSVVRHCLLKGIAIQVTMLLSREQKFDGVMPFSLKSKCGTRTWGTLMMRNVEPPSFRIESPRSNIGVKLFEILLSEI